MPRPRAIVSSNRGDCAGRAAKDWEVFSFVHGPSELDVIHRKQGLGRGRTRAPVRHGTGWRWPRALGFATHGLSRTRGRSRRSSRPAREQATRDVARSKDLYFTEGAVDAYLCPVSSSCPGSMTVVVRSLSIVNSRPLSGVRPRLIIEYVPGASSRSRGSSARPPKTCMG